MVNVLKKDRLVSVVIFICVCSALVFFFQDRLSFNSSDRPLATLVTQMTVTNQEELAFLSPEQLYVLSLSMQQLNKKIEDSDRWSTTLLVVQGLRVVQTISNDNGVVLDKYPRKILYTPQDVFESQDNLDRMLANNSNSTIILYNPPRPCTHKR